jgi:hypothetical protein
MNGGKVFASGLIGEGILGHSTLSNNFSSKSSASIGFSAMVEVSLESVLDSEEIEPVRLLRVFFETTIQPTKQHVDECVIGK